MENIEDDLIGLLAVAKRQQATLTLQMNAIETAAATLTSEREKIAVMLAEVRNVPNAAVGTLKTAVEASVAISIAGEKKALAGAVTKVNGDIDSLRQAWWMPFLMAIIGGVVAGVIMAYFQPRPLVSLDSEAIAAAITKHFQNR